MQIRRRGRHKTPSQVEKVAAQAGKAAPAMAIAGALVAVPHAQQAAAAAKPAATATAASRQASSAAWVTLDSFTASRTTGVAAHLAAAARQAADQALARNAGQALARNIDYTVKSGNTLSEIAQTFYHNATDWQWLDHENPQITNPNLIYPGQVLRVPANPPANYTLPDYVPRHAAPAASGVSSDSGSTVVTQSANEGTASSPASASITTASSYSSTGYSTLSGTLGCSGLEQLWEEAGGNPADAFVAAEIAMAESGGNQYALSPTDDYGYWQINASNGPLATFNAYGNARSAVILSDDGTNWSPWTTYTSGSYAGRC